LRKLVIASVVLVLVIVAISTTFGLLVLRPLPSIDNDERLLSKSCRRLRTTSLVVQLFESRRDDQCARDRARSARSDAHQSAVALIARPFRGPPQA
jgi:hypothetical protein